MSDQMLSRELYEALIRTETRPHATLHRAIREVLLAHDAALRAESKRLRNELLADLRAEIERIRNELLIEIRREEESDE